MKPLLNRFLQCAVGTTSIEYGMIAGGVSIVILTSIAIIGQNVLVAMFQKVANAL